MNQSFVEERRREKKRLSFFRFDALIVFCFLSLMLSFLFCVCGTIERLKHGITLVLKQGLIFRLPVISGNWIKAHRYRGCQF